MIDWDENSYDEERYLVADIRDKLLTQGQRDLLYLNDLSVEDLLNGRVPSSHNHLYAIFFDAWNAKIGRKVFGF